MRALVLLVAALGMLAAGCSGGDTSDSSNLAPKRDKTAEKSDK